MNPIKSMTRKIVRDVKETVKEEANKSKEEIKGEILETSTDILPYAALFIGGLILICIAKKPSPVVVKLVVKAV